jgi:hypothetical protein
MQNLLSGPHGPELLDYLKIPGGVVAQLALGYVDPSQGVSRETLGRAGIFVGHCDSSLPTQSI